MVEDLFKLALSTLQKKYGGTVKDDTWSLQYRMLGLTPVVLTVHRGPYNNHPIVAVYWETIMLLMSTELHISYDTHPTKVRWFMNFINVFCPSLKETSSNLFKEAEEYAYRVEADTAVKEEQGRVHEQSKTP